MFKRFKNVRPAPLIAHLIITLGYPGARAVVAENNKLQVFTDALTIVALILLIGGILYALVLHGHFDISSYFLQRGVRSFLPRRGRELEQRQTVDEYLRETRDRRAEAFNYPLFLGLLYLLISVVIAYWILT